MLSNGNAHLFQIDMGIKQFDSGGKLLKEINYPSKQENNSSIEILVHNEDGTLDELFEIPFHSFNRNFAISNFAALQQATAGTIYKTDGSSYSPGVIYTWAFNCTAPAANSNYGIVPGTGSSATTASAYKLDYQVPHGTTDNTLNYQTSTVTSPAYIGNSYGFSITRQFINQGSTTINIREIGLYGYIWGASTTYIMLSRDRIDKDSADININVGAGQTLTVRQNFYIDNSDGMTRFFLDYLAGTLGAQTVTMVPWTYPEGFANEISYALGQNYCDTWLFTAANAGIHRTGIAVGSSANVTSSLAVNSMGDFIYHGATSGSLTYAVQRYDSINDSGSYFSLTFRRTFTNNTASDITIRESGIFVCGEISATSGMQQNNTNTNSVLILKQLTGDITLSSTSATEISFTLRIPTQ